MHACVCACACVCALQESDVSGSLIHLGLLGCKFASLECSSDVKAHAISVRKSLASVAVVLDSVPLSNPFITPA